MVKKKKVKPQLGVGFAVVCKTCNQPLQKDESPIEHLKKHPITAYFDVVGYPTSWDQKT